MISDYCGVTGLYYFPNYLKDHDDVLSYVSQLPFEKISYEKAPTTFKYFKDKNAPHIANIN